MSPSKLVFSPEQVDVQDVEGYKRFRSKIEEWSIWLSGDKTHAIISHLHEMIWNHAVFKIVNETRRINSHKDFMSQNGLLAEFIDQSYVSFQATAVRRQLDRSSRRPEKQVISLRRLLDDIEQNRGLITRENYLAVEGLPYDWEPVRDRYCDSLRGSSGTVHWGDRTGPKAWETARRKQILFDQLSGVVPENRCRKDLIKDEVFSELKQLMSSNVLKKLRECTNKLIAHAADEFSRSSSDEKPQYFAIDEVEKCHEIFIRVTNALGSEILQIEHFGTFPTAQFDVFKFFDKPWVNKADMTLLSEHWYSYAEKIDKQARQNFAFDYTALYDH